MIKCKYCNKKFIGENNIKGHYAHCNQLRKIREEILNYNFLYENVVLKNRTANDIAKELNDNNLIINIDAQKIIKACKKFGIKTKTIKEATNAKNTREKYKKTCLEKYGAENSLSKNTIPYKKRNKTVNEKYGVDNVFQLDDVKIKSKKTLLKKYGVESPVSIPGRNRNNGCRSKIHIIVEDVLDKYNIAFESEKTGDLFKKYNNFLNKVYSPRPDIIIDELNIVIEINGEYWHGDPRFYKSNDIIHRFSGEILVKDVWEFDKIRKEQIESFGYKVMTLWEYDIKKNIEKVEKEIWEMLKLRQ